MPFQKGHKVNVGREMPQSVRVALKVANTGRAPWNKGLKTGTLSDEHKNNISKAHKRVGVGKWMKGRIAWNKGKKCPQLTGKNNGEWRGDDVGYRALHHWVRRQLGRPMKCVFCGQEQTKSGKKTQWANRSGRYLRDKGDWICLCGRCHKWYDRKKEVSSSHLPNLPSMFD